MLGGSNEQASSTTDASSNIQGASNISTPSQPNGIKVTMMQTRSSSAKKRALATSTAQDANNSKRRAVRSSDQIPITLDPNGPSLQFNHPNNPFLATHNRRIGGMATIAPNTPGPRFPLSPATSAAAAIPSPGNPIALLTPLRPDTPKIVHGQMPMNSTININTKINAPMTAAGKTDKGLRHFSARVSAKVEQKRCTTYNEVADELVQEIGREMGVVEKYDHKNIRRRVYDALNVLMAIDIIKKDKKEIRWLGLPTDSSQDVKVLEVERCAVEKRVAEKRKVIFELVQRYLALKALIARNQRSTCSSSTSAVCSRTGLILPEPGRPTTTSAQPSANPNDRLFLPFILVNAPKDCRVHCEMLEDRTQYFFEFDAPFFINEDIELLKLMGLDAVTGEEAACWLPIDLQSYSSNRPYNSSAYSTSSTVGQNNPKMVVRPVRKTLMSSPVLRKAGHNYPHYMRPNTYMSSQHVHTQPRNENINSSTGYRQPMSDICMSGYTPDGKEEKGLGRRFRETLSSFADFGSSPVI